MPIVLGFSAITGWLLGGGSQALAIAREGFDEATRLGHPLTMAYSWLMSTHLQMLAGNVAAVHSLSETGIAYCDGHKLLIWRDWLKIFRAWAVSEQGAVEEGVSEMVAGIAVNQACGARINTPFQLAMLSDGESRRGNLARALALVEEALAVSGENRLWESDLRRRRGELLAAQGPEFAAEAAESLRDALRVAGAQGNVPFTQRAEAALAVLELATTPSPSDAQKRATWTLSAREAELLGLLGRGLTDKAIAAELMVSLATVRSHLDRIRDKTSRRRRSELTRLAVELGLILD